MRKLIDLSGQKFGKLTVLKEAPKVKVKRRWTVQCECGRTYDLDGSTLTHRNVKACTSCAKVKHGQGKGTKVYRVWDSMKRRCLNLNHPDYKNYGARGIKFHDDWNDFQNFYRYVGEPPSSKHTLDRVDNDGNYEPGNVRWALMTHQIWNQRKKKNSSSQYKGVFLTDEGRFRARIWITKSKAISIGTFESEEEAARAYDKKAIELRGDNAKTNFSV